MKLIRFGNPGAEKPGLQLADGRWIDASGFGSELDVQAMVAVLVQAAQDGVPFCEECARTAATA